MLRYWLQKYGSNGVTERDIAQGKHCKVNKQSPNNRMRHKLGKFAKNDNARSWKR